MSRLPMIEKTSAFCIAMTACAVLASADGQPVKLTPSGDRASPSPKLTSLGRLPVTFERNTGRYDKRVKFVTRTRGATVFLTSAEMVMVMPGKAVGERQEAGGTEAGAAPRMNRRSAATNPAFAGSAANRRRSVSLGQTGDSSPGLGGRSVSAVSSQPSAVLRMKLVGASGNALATGIERQPGIVNYFIGHDPKKWRTRVPTYAKAKLEGVYPGIDVVYYGNEQGARTQEARGNSPAPTMNRRAAATNAAFAGSAANRRGSVSWGQPGDSSPGDGGRSLSSLSSGLLALEYDFVIRPGADPRLIKLAFEGADRVRVAGGDLILGTPAGDVRLKRPYAYQIIGGKRVQIACGYKLQKRVAMVQLARYDASRELVLDPQVEFMTYLGTSSYDGAHSVATDAEGAAYVTGYTEWLDFPTTPGAYDTSFNGWRDVFVTKFTPSGDGLVYSTFLGGSTGDSGSGIAVDAAGCAYVTGEARTGFPTTAGAAQTSDPGLATAFVTKLDSSGSTLIYSTLCGGSDDDMGFGIAVDGSGAAHICGYTKSSDIGTAGAFDTSYNGAGDAFVAKLSPSGGSFAYRTYLGGAQGDTATGIALAGGAAFVTGYTWSSAYPTSSGAFDTSYNGNADAFVTTLNSAGSALAYSTFLGSTADDWGHGIAADASGSAYVTGQTSGAFPTTVGAWDRTRNGDDCFVTKLDASGASLLYSTYFGGSLDEIGYSICLWDGRACFTGYTGSTNLHCSPDAFQSQHAGSWDAFVAILSETGSQVVYSTYMGGSSMDIGYGVSSNGIALCVAGWTWQSPKLPVYRAYDPELGNSDDAWVLKLDLRERAATTTTVPEGQTGYSGAPVTIQAVLTRQSDGSPVSGATLSFAIAATAVGTAVTDYSGTASLGYDVPANLGWGAGLYHIKAEYSGDDTHAGSVGYAQFFSWPYYVDGQVTWNGAPLEWVRVTLEGDTHVATWEASSGGLSVPDLGVVTSPIPMTWLGEIESARVQVNMNHTYSSDLRISVIHPDGTTVVLHDRSGWSLDYAQSVYPDVVTPAQSLAALAGKPASGTWTLKVEDMVAGDTGYLSSWYLGLTLKQTDPYDWSRSSGNYSFNPGAGTYTLRPWRDGYVFTPDTRTVTVGPEQHNLGFVARMFTVLDAADATGSSGGDVGLSATLTGALGGWVIGRTIAFTVDGTDAGSAVTDATGVATANYTIPLAMGEGSYAISAAFAGDAAYIGSTDTASLTVLPPADTTLYTIDRTGTITENVILRQYDLKRTTDDALLEGKTISYKIDGTEVGTGTTDAGGDSTLVWAITEGPTSRTITAEFSGDETYNPCSDDATLTAEGPWPVKFWAAVGINNRRITDYTILRAYLWRMDNTGIYQKTIGFQVDGTDVGTAQTNVQGRAQLYHVIFDGAGSGDRTVQATWAGDGGYQGKTGTATLTVLKAIPYVWVLPKTVPQGSIANLYAYFRRVYDYKKQEGKTVDFMIDGTVVQTVVTDANGVARYLYPTTEAPGIYRIRCEFHGDAWLDPGFGEANLTIY